jgi:3-isopropylmalate/(R)-2-methylmalate dehydratase small subunit
MPSVLKGKVWKFGDNISTDLMMPAFITDKSVSMSGEERARYCMFSNRPDWSAQVRPGDIIVGGKNFGCGSSRPAALPLITLGISVVIAESVGRIFFRNAINLGLPVMICQGVHQAFKEGEVAEVNIAKGDIRNVSTGKTLQGETLPADSPPMQVLQAGGIASLLEKYLAEQIRFP